MKSRRPRTEPLGTPQEEVCKEESSYQIITVPKTIRNITRSIQSWVLRTNVAKICNAISQSEIHVCI